MTDAMTSSPITLLRGDCLEILPTIADCSCDMALVDLPYGCLNKGNKHAAWDRELPLDALWEQWKRIVKPNGAIVLFGQGLFSAKLMMSEPKMYRYSLVWDKINRPTGFLDAKRKPLKIHEDILVFYRALPTYNPQMSIGEKVHSRGKCGNGIGGGKNRCYGSFKQTEAVLTNEKYPNTICHFAKEHGKYHHPTQKPVSLLEYLIRTYTNEGDCVLDCTMGSGSTMVACANTGRRGIGIELMQEYYDIAVKRVKDAQAQLKLDLAILFITRTMKYDNTPENSQVWRNRARERANRYWRKTYSDEEVREIAEEAFYEACRWLSEKIREEIRDKGI